METRNDTDRGARYDASAPQPADAKASIFEDFIDIFHSPSQVFARRANSGFGVHLLIISLVAAAFAFASRGYMSQVFSATIDRGNARMLEQRPEMTAEMLEKGRGFQEAIFNFFAYAGTPVLILVSAIFVMLAARWLAGARISYGQAATITTLAWIPRLLGIFVATIQIALMDTSTANSMYALSASPARFMDPDASNPKLYALAGSLELFSIWSLILIGIGIAVVGKVPRSKGFVAAAVVFVLGALLALMG